MTRCGCDRADLDRYGDRCWQCFVDEDIVRYERSVVAIEDMRRRVDEAHKDASDEAEVYPDSDSADSVSYVRMCGGRETHGIDRLAA